MANREPVKTLRGICHKCHKAIADPDKPIKYRGNIYHEHHLPTKPEEKIADRSYT